MADGRQVRRVSVRVDFVNQGSPVRVVHALELSDILLVLFLEWEGDGDHVSRAQAADVQLDVTGHEGVVEPARTLLPCEHDHLVFKFRHIAQTGTVLIVRPEILTIWVEYESAHGY